MSLEHDINCLLTITKATELPSLSGVLLSLCLRAISNRSLHYLSRQEIPVGVTPVPQPSALGQSTLAIARPTIPSKAQAGGGPYQKPAGSVTGRFTTTVSRQNPDETRPNSMGTAPPVHLASGQEPRAAQARFLSPSHPRPPSHGSGSRAFICWYVPNQNQLCSDTHDIVYPTV